MREPEPLPRSTFSTRWFIRRRTVLLRVPQLVTSFDFETLIVKRSFGTQIKTEKEKEMQMWTSVKIGCL